jgi:hypothetical protein
MERAREVVARALLASGRLVFGDNHGTSFTKHPSSGDSDSRASITPSITLISVFVCIYLNLTHATSAFLSPLAH